jgi:Fe(3+) dicitrate transport protein
MQTTLKIAGALVAAALLVPRPAQGDEPTGSSSTVANDAVLPPPAASSAPDAAPAPSDAPPAADSAQARTETAEVRVIGEHADALQRVPGSGHVITKEDLRRAQPIDVGEMLRRVPGVQARQEYGGGLRLDISVRGLEGGRSRRVLVLEDGVPIALNPYAEPDMYYSPPIERMRGVEVVKGSGSILFGPQTIGGVVNFLTLLPEETQRLSFDADAGDLGYRRGVVTYNDYFSGARYVVQALYREGDGPRNEGFKQTDLLAKMAVDTSARGEAILKLGFHNDSADSDDVGLTRGMYQADPRRGTLAPGDHINLRRYDASLTHVQTFSPTSKLTTLAYAYTLNRIWNRQSYLRSRAPGEQYDSVVGDESLPYGAIYFQHSDVVLDRQYDVAGVEPKFEQRFSTAGVGHTMDVGARVLTESAHYQQRTGDSPTSYSGSLDAEEKHSTIAFATYAEDRMAFRDYLLVTPGIRIEHPEYQREVLRQGGRDVMNTGDSRITGVIPGIGMVAGTKQAHVFAGIHEGWAPPRVTSSINPKGDTAQLNAERSLNYEIGTRLAPAKWLKGDATLFLSKFDNQVILNTAAAGADQTSETDGGTTRHSGVELSETTQFGRLFGLDAIVDLGVRYTYSRAVFVGGPNDGNLLPYSSLHGFNTNFDVEEKHGFGGQVAYNFVSSQFTDAANTVAEDATGRIGKIPAHHIVDVTGHYRHKPSGLSFRLTIKNLLDDVYIQARRPEGIFAAGFRQIIASVRWDFERPPPLAGAPPKPAE